MRICMFSIADINQPYGSTTRPYFLGKHLARQGIGLVHICERLSGSEGHMKIISCQDYAGKSKSEVARLLSEQCRQFSPDLIYSHQAFSAWTGLKLGRLLKKPHVFDAHSSLAQELPTFTGLPLKVKIWRITCEVVALRRSDRIIAPSPELKAFFVKKYHLRPDKIRIVKNGVETDTFRPTGPDPCLRERLGIPREAILILFTIPRLATFPSNEMALHSLFKLVPEIERTMPNVRFLILGGGPELRGPSPNVIYTGYVEDLPAYLNLADICVAPYPPQAVCGGTRNKICEYLACGKPLVATKEAMRGFDDALPGEHFLLADGDPDFVSRLGDCIRHPEMARRIGQNARRLSEKYDWSHLATKVIEVFQEVERTWSLR
jgi:glycosyltransferase involved in cell wall biosynthesis